MNRDLVSIVVAIYNVAECLPRCIESLMAQTYEQIEILLINDGSTDESGTICEHYAALDPRIRYIKKENGGLSDARNTGIRLSKGFFICFVDGDDFMDRRYIEILRGDIVNYDVGISSCSFNVYHDGDELIEPPYVPEDVEIFDTETALSHLFTKEKYANYAWNKLYRRDLFDTVQFPVGRKMEDMGCMYRLVGQCRGVSYNPIKLCNYYQRATSILHNRDKKFYDDKYFLVHERYQWLKERYPDMLYNELYMMIVILDAYPYMEESPDTSAHMEALMERFPASHASYFPPRYVTRYEMYCADRKQYREVYCKLTDKD